MEIVRKLGMLTFDGTGPMKFVESQNIASFPDIPPEQEAILKIVPKVIDAYVKDIEKIAQTKFDDPSHKIPEYMSHPGDVLVMVCTDGVVVRYERKFNEKRKTIAAHMENSVVQVASLLSQNLIHIHDHDTLNPPNENFGIEFKLTGQPQDGGELVDLVTARICFQVVNTDHPSTVSLGAKPYCLLSVISQIDFELHGELCPNDNEKNVGQPFVARSTVNLNVGWDCIEVFPNLNLKDRNPDFTPLWAERDLLGAALAAQMNNSRLSNLDPKAFARKHFSSLLATFKALLDSDPDREQVLQTFLQSNPELLCPAYQSMWPKLQFGACITDFVFRDANHNYLLVELERSTLKLFKQDGHETADLTHAQGQIIDWIRYLEDNLHTVQRELGLTGITTSPNGLVVIGRTKSLRSADRRKLQTIENRNPKLRIMTYDDLYENAKTVIENLLGPIWDTGGLTQIYYPNSAPILD